VSDGNPYTTADDARAAAGCMGAGPRIDAGSLCIFNPAPPGSDIGPGADAMSIGRRTSKARDAPVRYPFPVKTLRSGQERSGPGFLPTTGNENSGLSRNSRRCSVRGCFALPPKKKGRAWHLLRRQLPTEEPRRIFMALKRASRALSRRIRPAKMDILPSHPLPRSRGARRSYGCKRNRRVRECQQSGPGRGRVFEQKTWRLQFRTWA